MEYEIEGYRIVAVRFRLGFGLYIEHDESKPVTEEDSITGTAYFDGLVLGLPFFEILIGTLWLATRLHQKKEEEPPTK